MNANPPGGARQRLPATLLDIVTRGLLKEQLRLVRRHTRSILLGPLDLRICWLGLGLHTAWGGGQFRHPDFPKSLGNRENP